VTPAAVSSGFSTQRGCYPAWMPRARPPGWRLSGGVARLRTRAVTSDVARGRDDRRDADW